MDPIRCSEAATSVQILRDYVTELDAALAAGDDVRAAGALSTIGQQAHLVGLGLSRDPSTITPALTGADGWYRQENRPAGAVEAERPQAGAVEVFLARVGRMTPAEARAAAAAWSEVPDGAWGAAWDAAWGVDWGAARVAARDAAQDAAWDAARGAAQGAAPVHARYAAQDAAGALVVRDLIDPEHYATLTGPMLTACPDLAPLLAPSGVS